MADDKALEQIMDAKQKAFETVVETKMDALSAVVETKMDALGDRMQSSLETVKNSMDLVQDTIVSSVEGFTVRLDQHEKDDLKEFKEVKERVVDSEKKIIKMIAVGGIVLIIM